MIDSTQFRKGNIISARFHMNDSVSPDFFWRPITIWTIHESTITTTSGQSIDLEDKYLKYEQLTEEWLVKFGFDENNSIQFIKPDKTLDLFQGKNTNKIYWYPQLFDKENVITLNRIQYVHQLQNLYHVLCGNELHIKKKATELNPFSDEVLDHFDEITKKGRI